MQTFPTSGETAEHRANREKRAAEQDKQHSKLDATADKELAKFLRRCKRKAKSRAANGV